MLTLSAATVSTLVGVAVALHLSRLPERRRTLLSFVIALPLTFSGLIVAYGFILGYGRAGFVTQLLGYAGFDPAIIGKALFTPVGLAFASSYYLIPRVVMGILPVLVNFDRAQLAAAESLGATPSQAFRQIMLPQVAAPVGAAFCLVAAVVFGAYGTALALVGTQLHILPLQLYSLISETGRRFSSRRRARAADHRGLLGHHEHRRMVREPPRAPSLDSIVHAPDTVRCARPAIRCRAARMARLRARCTERR